jgi:transcriptional regulator with XRE-family HTH domain
LNIGEKIKELRKEKKLTQSELAEKSGLSRVSIGNYERCDRIPDAIVVKKIADALNVKILDLYEVELNSEIILNKANDLKIPPWIFLGLDKETFLDNINDQNKMSEYNQIFGEYLKDYIGITEALLTKEQFDREDKLDNIQKLERDIEEMLIEELNKLNSLGKAEALKRIKELAQLTQYKR